MITEGYFAKIKDYPATDILICVARKYPWFVKKGKMEHSRVLAPHPEILEGLKNGDITWGEYEERFRFDMTHYTKPIGEFRYLRNLARNKVVRLMCWERADDKKCHRFILLDLIHCSVTRVIDNE